MRRRVALAVLVGLALVSAGCATVPKDPAALAEFKANNDPIEPFNRKMFSFNLLVDRVLIKPIAKGYRWTFPENVRDALRGIVANLHEPLVLVNCVLQGRLGDAARTGDRFVVNSTIGIVGINDVATRWKVQKQIGDFGQTLWTWGCPEGPYLVIPVFGPRNTRDGVGEGADTFFDPLHNFRDDIEYSSSISAFRIVVGGIDQRERALDTLDEIQHESIDYYASLRSLYRQNRAAELRGGKTPTTLTPTDFYDEPGH